MDSTSVDFRSDTMTRPTPAMRAAIAAADVGDDVFGEDPTVNELERRGAELLGKEAALFVPSGTMANQIAVHVHCRAGDELLCESGCHVFLYEAGSVARLSGVQVRTVGGTRGFPTAEDVFVALRADDPHYPRSRLLVVENTHNLAGGTVLDFGGFDRLALAAREFGLIVHVDGARLANAAVALGVSPAELAAPADSVSLCLSKGLGAPVGSLLAGTGHFVREARRARKAFGGGMRQAGFLAAAGLLAISDGLLALPGDHERARRLALGLEEIEGCRVVPPDTNIVMMELVDVAAPDFVADMERRGVRLLAFGKKRVRFVTYRDLDDGDVDRCIAAVAEWAGHRAGAQGS